LFILLVSSKYKGDVTPNKGLLCVAF
jgi:hypothetical protein